ncbi:MAG: gliding motility-associated ABC transporter substrate-binding protein GldG [Cyclobacteriaceae bacterium]|nr:gliding motility-associated ABC transporter substrate-binding protein GldG [Cyclobacteriaceae bacterium]
MVKLLETRKLEGILKYLIGILLLILLNIIASRHFTRLDLTEEGRYTIKPATVELLTALDDNVYIDVYLEGDLNAGFKRLQKAVQETLEEFEFYSDHKVIYRFVDPGLAMGQNARNEFMANLAAKGITPTNVIDTRDGERIEKIIFPGAIVSYGGIERAVMLLSGMQGEEQLNNSIEGVEYAIASTIYKLTRIERKRIGFIQGHDELDSLDILSLQNALFEFYELEEIDLPQKNISPGIDLIIIAQPKQRFSEEDKYKIDQFIMQGGKAVFMIDKLEANMDSASNEMNLAFPYQQNLDDMLFRYGIRLNNDLIQDNNAALYPIVIGYMGTQPQVMQMPWPFFPLLNQFQEHPISRNLNMILGRFVSTMDTVKADGVIKTPLLFTSNYSRSMGAPVKVSVNDLRNNLKPQDFNSKLLPVAYLLEGTFQSVFKNRFLPKGANASDLITQSQETKILVISDGDIARNEINPTSGQPEDLGTVPWLQGIHFSNQEFLLNAIAYLTDENGIITARNKEVMVRPLDKVKISQQKLKWQIFNMVLPVATILALGLILFLIRIKKNTKFISE